MGRLHGRYRASGWRRMWKRMCRFVVFFLYNMLDELWVKCKHAVSGWRCLNAGPSHAGPGTALTVYDMGWVCCGCSYLVYQ